MKNKEPSAMDCWHFIAPIIPVNDDFSMEVYVKTFQAFKLLEEEEKKKNGKMYRMREKNNGDQANYFS